MSYYFHKLENDIRIKHNYFYKCIEIFYYHNVSQKISNIFNILSKSKTFVNSHLNYCHKILKFFLWKLKNWPIITLIGNPEW